jgi:hypothetical protein
MALWKTLSLPEHDGAHYLDWLFPVAPFWLPHTRIVDVLGLFTTTIDQVSDYRAVNHMSRDEKKIFFLAKRAPCNRLGTCSTPGMPRPIPIEISSLQGSQGLLDATSGMLNPIATEQPAPCVLGPPAPCGENVLAHHRCPGYTMMAAQRDLSEALVIIVSVINPCRTQMLVLHCQLRDSLYKLQAWLSFTLIYIEFAIIPILQQFSCLNRCSLP